MIVEPFSLFNLVQYYSSTHCIYDVKQLLIKYLKNRNNTNATIRYQQSYNFSVVKKILTHNTYLINQKSKRKLIKEHYIV